MDKTQYYGRPNTKVRADWEEFRKTILERDKTCRGCGEEHGLEVHHITYIRFNNEKPEDVITLCRLCHEAITNRIREERYSLKEGSFYAEDIKVKINRERPIDFTQQQSGGSAGLLRERDKKGDWKKVKNRSRS